MLSIRVAEDSDFDSVWPIFHDIVAAGDTYAYERETTREDAFRLWMRAPRQTYVADVDGEVLGTYYIKTNHAGPGAHVCNCGYMVARSARGHGLATAMCEHSQQAAVELGYEAMQFNFVAASNVGAVRLWQKLGFDVIGRIPSGFRHPSAGLVDALIMYKWLV